MPPHNLEREEVFLQFGHRDDPLDDIVEEYYPVADSKKQPPYRRYLLDLLNSRLKYRGLLMNTPANVYMQLAASVIRSSTSTSLTSSRRSSSIISGK